MGSFSDFAEAAILNHAFGGATWTPPATLHIALFTANPSDSGGGTEVTGGSYARVAKTNNATNFPAASGTSPATKSNGTAIDFPAATADWGTITGMAVYDAASGGNMIGWTALTVSKPILSGDTASFPIGTLQITLD
jgi:hypothetical protein